MNTEKFNQRPGEDKSAVSNCLGWQEREGLEQLIPGFQVVDLPYGGVSLDPRVPQLSGCWGTGGEARGI